VAFQRSEEGREDSDIWLIGTDGTGEADLARSTAKEGAPTWSADGARIVFTSDRAGGSFELYSMAGDGSDVRQLTHRARVVTNSSYSLEGGRVAFLDCRAEFTNCTVWGGRSEDTARQLSRIPADRVRPAWSPDGGMLAFSIPAGPGGQGGDVAVVNGTGAGGHRLTSDHLSTGPAWSPDGTSIVFSSVRDDAQSLYVMRADGTGVRRLTHPDKGLSDSEPTWQR
jgi:TolB protein